MAKVALNQLTRSFFKVISPSGQDLRASRKNTKNGSGKFHHIGKGRFYGDLTSEADGSLSIDVGAPPTIPVDASIGATSQQSIQEGVQSFIELEAHYSGTFNDRELKDEDVE
jgi:hypothetical protein